MCFVDPLPKSPSMLFARRGFLSIGIVGYVVLVVGVFGVTVGTVYFLDTFGLGAAAISVFLGAFNSLICFMLPNQNAEMS